MTKSRHILPPRRPWADWEIELLRRNYADSLTADIARALERSTASVYKQTDKLGLTKSIEFIAQTARERSLRPDHGARRHRFPKGHVPANKGLRRPGWAPGEMAKTQFKKGAMPHTWVPVGSYRVNPDGYVEFKFSDEPGPYTKRWEPVHRRVWREANGPVPSNHAVVFKPGRKTTDPALITPDAIELVTRQELMRRISYHTNLPKELAQLVQLRSVVNRQINKRAKEST